MRTFIVRFFMIISFGILSASYAFADIGAELQWVFCGNQLPDVISALGLPQPQVQNSQNVYYLETLNHDFEAHSIFVKFRQRNGRKIKSSVKVRFAQQSDIPNKYLSDSEIECEKDVYIDDVRWSCALKNEGKDYELSKGQQEFLTDNGISQNELQAAYLLGPLAGTESEVTNQIQYEEMQTPEGQKVAEFSVRTDLAHALSTQSQWALKIGKARLKLCEKQSGKRSVVLDDLWQGGMYKPYNP